MRDERNGQDEKLERIDAQMTQLSGTLAQIQRRLARTAAGGNGRGGLWHWFRGLFG